MANSALVTTGKPKIGGAVYRAPLGTTLPTDTTTALDNAFIDVGYISEDGVTANISRESEDIKDWGGTVLTTTQTSKTDTINFTMVEALNVEALKVVHGDANVTGTLSTGITVTENATELDAHAWVIDMVNLDGTAHRSVYPSAKVSEIEEIVYNATDPVGYGVTLTAMPDASGNTHYEYFK